METKNCPNRGQIGWASLVVKIDLGKTKDECEKLCSVDFLCDFYSFVPKPIQERRRKRQILDKLNIPIEIEEDKCVCGSYRKVDNMKNDGVGKLPNKASLHIKKGILQI